MFWSANDRTIIIIMTKIKQLVSFDWFTTTPTHCLACLHQAGGPRPGGPVAAVIPSRGRVASLLLALAAMDPAVPGSGVWDEGGASGV